MTAAVSVLPHAEVRTEVWIPPRFAHRFENARYQEAKRDHTGHHLELGVA